ncbi:MAG: leucine-rich repeat protein [Oscillospiraceae bacterium]|nr:leucine-rich repeat protein [Oscillospiraceae bacterium]
MIRKKRGRVTALALTAAMAMTLPAGLLADAAGESAPGSILAQDDPEPAEDVPEVVTGSAGSDLTFTLNTRTGLLTVSGTGSMVYTGGYYSEMPFYAYRDYIRTAVFEEGVTSIGDYAFLKCANLTSVTIPDTVTTISTAAFKECTSLRTLVIPDTVTKLGTSLFNGCTSLTSVTLPEGLTELPGGASTYGFFENCTSLTSFTIPAGITRIGNRAFSGCTALSAIRIPDTVTSIGNQAFQGCEALESVSLPGSVTSLGSGCFQSCLKLQSVTLPAGLDRISASLFSGCGALRSITLPETVTVIEENAFAECTSLTGMQFPDGIVSIGSSAFQNCTSLRTLRFPEGFDNIGSLAFDGTAFLAEQDDPFVLLNGTVLYKYQGLDTSVTVPDGVTSIADGAFSSVSDLTAVTIPKGVTRIGAAFRGCTSLKSVTLPNTLQELGDEAFRGCSKLESILLPSSLTTIGDRAFFQCTSLGIVDLSYQNSLTRVGGNAFSGTPYTAGKTGMIIIGQALYQYIGNEADPKIPNDIVSISPGAFAGNLSIEELHLPASVRSIGKQAFIGCQNLSSVNLPDTVTEIGTQAFGYYYSDGKSGDILAYPFTFYGHSGSVSEAYVQDSASSSISFVNIDNLQGDCNEDIFWTVSIETGTLTISGTGKMPEYSNPYGENQAPYLQYQNIITSVEIDEGITSVGSYAFYNLKHLRSVSLPDGLTSIGAYAFAGCTSLSEIAFPDTVRSFGNSVFARNMALTSVTLPAGMTNFNPRAFSESGITQFLIDDENQYFQSKGGVLYSKNLTRLVAYPQGKADHSFTIPDTVTAVGDYAFYRQQYLTSVTFPASVTSAGGGILYDMPSLERLVFLGDVPESRSLSNDLPKENITYYCYFDKAGWEPLRSSMTSVTWVDLAGYGDSDTLTVEADHTTLKPGEALQLSARLNPVYASEFVWSSDAPGTAHVFSDGRVLALNPGTVTVTAASPDGQYQGSVTLRITGSPYEIPQHELHELSGNELEYSSANTVFLPIPCKELRGIYLLNGTSLTFRSLISHETEPVCTFRRCNTAYAANNKLYYSDGTTCYVYDLLLQDTVLRFPLSGYSINAVGADAQGRIYLAGTSSQNSNAHKLFLFNDKGELLSSANSEVQIYSFNGFDESSGNFFMESHYNWVYWGYDHPGHAATMGKVQGNEIMTVNSGTSILMSGLITYNLDCIDYLCQDWYLEHQNSVSVEGDHYLVTCSTTYGRKQVIDADALSGCYTLTNPKPDEPDSNEDHDTGSVGTRSAYNEINDSIITYDGNKMLTEYTDTGEIISDYETAHYVFSMEQMDNTLLLFEKEDGKSYLELVTWDSPTEMHISGSSDTLAAGSSMQLTLSFNSSLLPNCTWSSSDPSIVSIDQSGIAVGWNPGKAVITATSSNGLTATYPITVTGTLPEAPESAAVIEDATVTDNQGSNSYSTYSDVVRSYLHELPDGTLERVESTGEGILVETYRDGQVLSRKTLENQLPIFGGCFFGSDDNFLVFGQSNPEESDAAEVLRVVKYSKDWEILDSASVYGANTYIPFDAGSLRMAEYDGTLYIHTAHEMYDEGDGLHHQANMTFVYEESSLRQLQSYYDVLNLDQAGYVSHSFNQFVKTDGTSLYRVDHGDAAPRAVTLTRCSLDGSITDVAYTYALPINGYGGNNSTGVSVGGFELSAQNCLIAGNSVDQGDNYSAYGQRNIFLSVVSKDLKNKEIKWITSYTPDDHISPATPQLVRISEHAFLLMWEEYRSETNETVTRMCTLNADGQPTSEIITTFKKLSDCQPFYASDKLVKWYTTDGMSLTIYQQNPFLMQNEEAPTEALPTETDPPETETLATEPVETDPPETETLATEPVETDPPEAETLATEPVETDPPEAETLATEPVETEPTEPTQPADLLIPGDVNGDSLVNASDAAQILIAAANIGAGNSSGLTIRQWSVANVNYDSTVNATDAAQVLIYAAYIGAGGTTSPTDYFKVP